MKVAFNARLLCSPTLRGWNRYTINLLRELPALGVELFLYSDRPLHEGHLVRLPVGSFQVRVAPSMRYLLWEERWLPRQCRRDRVDLLHCPFNFGLPWFSPCPRVLTLHDAIDQVYYAPRQTWFDTLRPAGLQSRFYHWIARRRAEHFITDSEHAKGDLVRYLKLPPERMRVIHLAADPQFHEPIPSDARQRVRRKHGLARPYVFYIGGWEQRKNVPFLVRAFAAAQLTERDLVLAGGRPEQRAVLQGLARDLGIEDRLRLLNWVEDEDLPALYAEALCFVYPSVYEGFGLQLCEAMAVGCPVLAANATSLPEVLGDGGMLFGLDRTDELARSLEEITSTPTVRERLSKSALKRSADLSWRTTAEETVQVYRAISKHHERHASVS